MTCAPEPLLPPGSPIHASALLIGPRAVVIRGPSGAGKSGLTLALLAEAQAEGRFCRLIGDDRVVLTAAGGRLIVSGIAQLSGLIELRGKGILEMPLEAAGVVGLVVDLVHGEPTRYPLPEDIHTVIEGISVPRLAVAGYGEPRSRMVLTALTTPALPVD